MPISPIILQRRHAELGRIRLGAKKDGHGLPMKLEAFRFTSASQSYIQDLATLYGGTAVKWDNNGKPEWEVFTDAQMIPVIAVKGGLSQWLEHWSGGGCVHRCDGETNVLTGELCDTTQMVTISRKQVPIHDAVKPTTRLSVMLPELEAIGVFRMETHGWNAAAEIPAVAELAQFVGDLVPANLHLVERRSVKDGQTSRFVVPVLDLQIGQAKLREIVAERMGERPLELVSGGGVAAIEAPGRVDDGAQGWFDRLESLTDLDHLRELWADAVAANFIGPHADPTGRAHEFVEAWKVKATAGPVIEKPLPVPDADGVVDAELVDPDTQEDMASTAGGTDDADAVWTRVLTVTGVRGMSLNETNADFAERFGFPAGEAGAPELLAYLDQLNTQAVA